MQKKINETIQFFESKEVDRLEKLIRFVTTKLENALAERQILARVSSRVKISQSLRAKLLKWAGTSGHLDFSLCSAVQGRFCSLKPGGSGLLEYSAA